MAVAVAAATAQGTSGAVPAASALHVGVYLPQVGFSWEDVRTRAMAADRLGLHSLWFYDHLYAPGLPGLDSLEGWTLASYVLAQTERLRVGHLVLCANFRHPAVLAKMISTLDVCSGGRLEVGLGSGSVAAEHRQAGLAWGDAAERAGRLEETLEVVSALVSVPEGESAPAPLTFAGRHFALEDMPSLPPPVQRPRPPIHVGGIGRTRTLPLAARFADVWNLPTYGLDRWREHLGALDEACAAVGRDPATLRRSVQGMLVLVPDEASLAGAEALAERRFGDPAWGLRAGGFVGTAPRVVERISEMAAAGVDSFVFFTHDRAAPATLELLAAEVLPALD